MSAVLAHQIYRHHLSGKRYRVLSVAYTEASYPRELEVVYRCIQDGKTWTRPLREWLQGAPGGGTRFQRGPAEIELERSCPHASVMFLSLAPDTPNEPPYLIHCCGCGKELGTSDQQDHEFAKEGESLGDTTETIDSAAVFVQDLVFSVPRPLRHDGAILAACAALRRDTLGEHDQGFVTNRGRFVDRDTAGKIAAAAGQIDKAKYLFTEDLW